MRRLAYAAMSFGLFAMLAGCTHVVAVAHIHRARQAATQPAMGKTTGDVVFTQQCGGVHVHAKLSGLPPGKHGIHIHENGDLSAADLSSAGGHFNPEHHPHGGPTTSPVHGGDLGNITADVSGNATLDLTVHNISIGGKNDILGKAVIIHADADDLSSQPSGNAGPRIAGGVIERKAPEPAKKKTSDDKSDDE